MTIAFLAAVVAMASASACLAEVIDVAPDGSFARYDAPAVHTRDGPATIVSALTPVVNRKTTVPPPVAAAIASAAQYYALSADLIEAVAWQESRFRHVAVSGKGAAGVMQLMPGTARDLGVDRRDLDQNVRGGTAYLTQMLNRYGGDVELALAAYNAGPGAVDRYGGIPPYAETKAYVAAILERLAYLADQPG